MIDSSSIRDLILESPVVALAPSLILSLTISSEILFDEALEVPFEGPLDPPREFLCEPAPLLLPIKLVFPLAPNFPDATLVNQTLLFFMTKLHFSNFHPLFLMKLMHFGLQIVRQDLFLHLFFLYCNILFCLAHLDKVLQF